MEPATEGTRQGRPVSHDDILKVFASRTNRSILGLLAVEPTYPRKIGNILSLSEAEVARRLKQMEGLGIVSGAWSFVGKNIKLYKLAADHLVLRFGPEGLKVDIVPAAEGTARTFTVLPFSANVPAIDGFVGRSDETHLLSGPDPVTIVEGLPGVGKTALIAHYAENHRAGREVFWHSFRGLESLHWLVNRFAVFLAQQGNRALLVAVEQGLELPDLRDLMLRGMDDERFLVVFDDANRADDPAVRQFLTDAIEQVQKAKLIIATREVPRFNQSLPGRRVLRLAGLKDQDVSRFFEERQIALASNLLPKVREEVGGHPMALNLLLEASKELKVPVEKLLDKIPERQVEDYLLQEVYAGLTEDDKAALTLASLFRAGFTPETLAAVAKKPYEHVLLRLRRRGLVQFDGHEYFLHEMIRNFFYKLLQDKEALHARAAAHYLGLDTLEGRLEAMHHYTGAAKRDQILHLIEEDMDLQEFDAIDAGYQNLYFSILEQFQRAEVTDPKRWALIQDEKGDILLHRGEADNALKFYDDAHAYFLKAKEKERIADLSWKRALAHRQLGDEAEARRLVDEGLKEANDDGAGRKRLEELQTALKKPPPRKKVKAAR